MEKNKKVKLKLEDKNSGDLFAACPIGLPYTFFSEFLLSRNLGMNF